VQYITKYLLFFLLIGDVGAATTFEKLKEIRNIEEQMLNIVVPNDSSVRALQQVAGIVKSASGSGLTSNISFRTAYGPKESGLDFDSDWDNRAAITFSYPLIGGVNPVKKDKAATIGNLWVQRDRVKKDFLITLSNISKLKQIESLTRRQYSYFFGKLANLKQANEKLKLKGRVDEGTDITELMKIVMTLEAKLLGEELSYKNIFNQAMTNYGQGDWWELRNLMVKWMKLVIPMPARRKK